jgi:hypothetical protein
MNQTLRSFVCALPVLAGSASAQIDSGGGMAAVGNLTNQGSMGAIVAAAPALILRNSLIEIRFRAWKQSLNLTKALNRKTNEHHMQALVLAAMIAHQLGMRIARRIGAAVGRARLSHEKLYDMLAGQFIKAPDMAAIFDFEPYPDHVMRDKRRRPPVESGIRVLT